MSGLSHEAAQFIQTKLCATNTSLYRVTQCPLLSSHLTTWASGHFKNQKSSDQPREAQYPDEFHRALHDFTKGSILVSPECFCERCLLGRAH
jgi:hypothetical protein